MDLAGDRPGHREEARGDRRLVCDPVPHRPPRSGQPLREATTSGWAPEYVGFNRREGAHKSGRGAR